MVAVPRSERAAAEARGIRLLRSIDGDLWLASVPRADLVADRAADRAVGRSVPSAWDLRPEDRCAPDLWRVARGEEERFFRVKFFADVSWIAARAQVAAFGGTIESEAPRLGVLDVSAPARVIRDLAALDEVRWIEPISRTYDFANNDMRVSADVQAAQNIGLTGAGVRLGQWDSGLADATHPDLVGRVLVGEVGIVVNPHATHVAGTAIGDGTASASQGGGSLQWRGVATGAEIVGWGVTNHLAEVDTAITVWDVDLTTNSWVYPVDSTNCALYGDYGSSAPEFDQIVNGLYGKRIPVVFAAGNERDDPDCGIAANGGYACIPPPGTAKNVITVGAHHSDAGHMTPFSSWGPTDDGRMKPDMAAPGCQASGDFGITSAQVGGTYWTTCGTSMATPVVSGAVALILEDWSAQLPGVPRPATSKALLGGFADDRAIAGPDYRFGLGAVQVGVTIDALRTMTTVEDEVADGVTDTWTFWIPSGAPELKITLVWDDPVGAELADTTLVNDLDLELVGPTSGTHLPFVLDPANPSAAAVPGVNRLDNVEQVVVASPEAGWWTARVIGTTIPQGPQEYSLVGFDRRPPADPASFAAVATGDTTAALTWIRAGDSDRAGTLVVRSLAPIAWTPAEGVTYLVGSEPAPGVVVVVADDVDHSGTPFTDTPLLPATTYHWTAFSRDEAPNWSVGVSSSATTTGTAVDAPLPVPASTAIRFVRTGVHPFRERATFRYDLPVTCQVSLEIVDATGRRVTTVMRGERPAGSHVAVWDGRDRSGTPVAAGVYFARFRAADRVFSEKLLRVR
ncbi:MAG: S8 family serine peptidase [bacterium]